MNDNTVSKAFRNSSVDGKLAIDDPGLDCTPVIGLLLEEGAMELLTSL